MKHSVLSSLRALRIAALALVAVGLAPLPADAQFRGRESNAWVSTWGASPSDPADALNNQTIRLHVRLSLGGDRIRIRLSNRFGEGDLLVGAVHVALHGTGSGTLPGTDRVVTFSDQPSFTLAKGAQVVSDEVALTVKALQEISVSIFLPGDTGPLTIHQLGVSTTYISPPGDFTASAVMPVDSTSLSRYLVSEVEVRRADAVAVVTLGDSITDGFASTVDANRRWPDFLAERLRSQQMADPNMKPVAVVDEGISGNRLLHDIFGPNAQERLDRDVLSKSHVKWVTLLEGINDLGFPGSVEPNAPRVTFKQIIGAYKQIIARAHAAGLKIYGCTLTPFEGTTFAGYFAPDKEEVRVAVNSWIRNSGQFDAVIDFDKAIRDPSHPSRMLPAYDSGDHLHPNDLGYLTMANAVPLSLFTE
ncbi:MAG TPA: SGNH/GDSL hydrolase family protein [Myxococcaceae bacterium]|jgi:lysophospholipase L1-like esterase|nr:SGNH/GDSL hydrolase family protein [Myxococcaceae bacterium]